MSSKKRWVENEREHKERFKPCTVRHEVKVPQLFSLFFHSAPETSQIMLCWLFPFEPSALMIDQKRSDSNGNMTVSASWFTVVVVAQEAK